MNARRIAILMHALDDPRSVNKYLISKFAEHWRRDGHEVFYLFGTREFVPADIAVVHVNLSMIPDEYLRFAARYPLTLNGRIRDIRKSRISKQLLVRDSSWTGPVIVKTDNNCGGMAERMFASRCGEGYGSVEELIEPESLRIRGPWGYVIYPSLGHVPRPIFDDPSLIVEKFLPEIEGNMYCVRLLSVLGDRASCIRLRGQHPILNGATAQHIELVPPHDEILAMKEALHCDYGKLDYVVVSGSAVLLDVNITIAVSDNLLPSAALDEERRVRAVALYKYFQT
jgi:hypothetical protein